MENRKPLPQNLPQFSSGWENKPLGAVAEIVSGATPNTGVSTYWNGSIPWCIPSDITGKSGKYLLATGRTITEAGLASCAANLLPSGTILLCSRATIGEIKIASFPVCTNQGFKSLICRETVCNEFVYYFLLTQKQKLVELATGSTFLEISKRDVESIEISLPPISEQLTIAEMLSDVDSLLEALDALIAKKQKIKTAVMQQLLTGKTRLPGFKDRWTKLNMARNSVLKARIGWQGLTTAEYRKEGKYYLVTGTDFIGGRVDWSSCYYVERSRFIQDANIQLKIGDVLLTKDGTIGKACFVDSLRGPATLNSGIYVIRPRDNSYISKFMFYVLTSRIFDDFLARLQAGSTISHLYQKDFERFTFNAPPPDEQRAIVTVLNDIDLDITSLERKRAKTNSIRLSMIQQIFSLKSHQN